MAPQRPRSVPPHPGQQRQSRRLAPQGGTKAGQNLGEDARAGGSHRHPNPWGAQKHSSVTCLTAALTCPQRASTLCREAAEHSSPSCSLTLGGRRARQKLASLARTRSGEDRQSVNPSRSGVQAASAAVCAHAHTHTQSCGSSRCACARAQSATANLGVHGVSTARLLLL